MFTVWPLPTSTVCGEVSPARWALLSRAACSPCSSSFSVATMCCLAWSVMLLAFELAAISSSATIVIVLACSFIVPLAPASSVISGLSTVTGPLLLIVILPSPLKPTSTAVPLLLELESKMICASFVSLSTSLLPPAVCNPFRWFWSVVYFACCGFWG